MGIRINEQAARAGTKAGEVKAAEAKTEPGEEGAVTARLFPSGTRALYRVRDGVAEPLGDSEPVKLVNVSLSVMHVRTEDTSIKSSKGTTEKVIVVKPFGTLTIPCLHARRALATQEKIGGDPRLVVAPSDGDCKGVHTFQAFGKTFRTCPWHDCATCGPAPERLAHSVFQVQHRISMLGTEAAIRRVIETIDSRTPVVLWGLEIISQRIRAKQERLGLVGAKNLADVVF